MGVRGKIFVSYRREDAPGDARSICDRLGRSFGAANVFMDVDNLLAGQRFDLELDKALAECDVLIAVIGSRWMELLSDYAQRGKRDYVRDEIAAAVKRDIVVIPLLIGREESMPSLPMAEHLPENIRDLVLYQKQNVAHENFNRDAAHLVAAIRTVLRDRRDVRPWRAIAAAAMGVIGLGVAVALFGDWMDLVTRISPRSVGTSETKVAVTNSDAASKKAAEEARKKAELAAADCDRLAASPYDGDRPSGVVGVRDYKRIETAATAACDVAMRSYPEVARFVLQAGRAALAQNDYTKTERLFRTAIAKGSVSAVVSLGVMYGDGLGVAQDYAEARRWYEKGAALGNALAMNRLGALYEYGRGVAQDYAEARRWYEKGVALGDARAMNNLGHLYRNGRGVTRDFAEARKWYEQAIALGDGVAMANLGTLYEDGQGVTQDFAEARRLYEKGAALESSNAMTGLGRLYEYGKGTAQDYAAARKWYELAADRDHWIAMYNLGSLYENGRGVAQDYAAARTWYEKAASLGNATAMFRLGVFYENGNGVTKDPQQARTWFQKSADAGNNDAKEKLKNIK